MKGLWLALACLAFCSLGAAADPLVKGRFQLVDARDGRPVSQDSYRSKLRLVFFGFTHCRLTCPVGLSKLSGALQALGKDAGSVAAIFITTDPKRDSAAVMAAYTANFDARIIPLTGSESAIKAAMRSFRLEAQKSEERSEDEYQMEHPAILYLMDRQGRYLEALPSSGDPVALAQRVRKALQGK